MIIFKRNSTNLKRVIGSTRERYQPSIAEFYFSLSIASRSFPLNLEIVHKTLLISFSSLQIRVLFQRENRNRFKRLNAFSYIELRAISFTSKQEEGCTPLFLNKQPCNYTKVCKNERVLKRSWLKNILLAVLRFPIAYAYLKKF